MPIQTTNIDANGVDGYDIVVSYLNYVIDSGVSVLATTGLAVSENYTYDVIDNFGLLAGTYGDGVAIYGSSNGDVLINEAGGSISGSDGVIVNGTNAYIANYGTITASDTGIFEFAGSGTHIENYGRISANSIGIEDSGLNDAALNYGSVSAIGTGFVFSLASGAGALENLGTISGMTAAITSSGAGALTVTNLGTLVGNVSLANSGGDTFFNKSSIEGSVTLGNGTNVFHGAGGTVDDTITGGSGSDTIHLGNDGETVDGRAGINKLYGGAGADTFIFSALGTSDVNKIFNFNVGADTIELESSVFTKLTADVAPNFKVATASTGPNNHLFYNSATGGLYYDADANGPGAAVMIGSVGAGLNLTTGNFTVV